MSKEFKLPIEKNELKLILAFEFVKKSILKNII